MLTVKLDNNVTIEQAHIAATMLNLRIVEILERREFDYNTGTQKGPLHRSVVLALKPAR